MNSYKKVDELVAGWIASGLSKEKIIANTCEAELGWPYVWGAVGAQCTPEKRSMYAGLKSCPASDAALIRKNCQVLSKQATKCSGCAYYPDDERVLIDDCQGFAKQVMSRVGISFSGGGCTSMWNTAANWAQKGKISEMPNAVCCVFYDKDGTKEHIGIHIGGGQIIHCSGTVKRGNTGERIWTHYAVPKGLEGGNTPMPVWKPTLRKGARGENVIQLQTKLVQLGYDLAPYGADGSFGNKTAEAVKAFQSDHGLIADGVCGPMTWDALDNTTPGKKYTATIRGLAKNQAVELLKQFPEAEITEEDS